jgi:hypothetical protein
MPMNQRVIVIGIDPKAVAHLGIDADMVLAALQQDQARFKAEGIASDLCLVGMDPEAATREIVESLRSHEYACVVIGGGIRKPEPMLEFFEVVINLVRQHAPHAAIAFNTNGGNSLEAALRWLPKKPDTRS